MAPKISITIAQTIFRHINIKAFYTLSTKNATILLLVLLYEFQSKNFSDALPKVSFIPVGEIDLFGII